jgi:Leucine-rich repeat (LRR) protein
LHRCENLEELNLAQNFLNNESVCFLCDALERHCSRLTKLDLSRNPISNAAGKRLSRLAMNQKMLTRIDVHDTLMNAGLARLISAKCALKSSRFDGLMALADAADSVRATRSAASSAATSSNPEDESTGEATLGARRNDRKVEDATSKADDWYAMETIWDLAAVAAPPSDGWGGLASVMALVRQDVSIATMY